MKAVLTGMKPDGAQRLPVTCWGDETKSKLQKMSQRGNEYAERVIDLQTRQATFKPGLGYSLDFGGRVTESSIKNFQLEESLPEGVENDGTAILQFGRVKPEEFSMDVRWPLCPAQAFGIALSVLENAGEEKVSIGETLGAFFSPT